MTLIGTADDEDRACPCFNIRRSPVRVRAGSHGGKAHHRQSRQQCADQYLSRTISRPISTPRAGTYSGNVIVVQGDTKHARQCGACPHRQRQGRQDHSPAAMWWWIRPPPARRPATTASMMWRPRVVTMTGNVVLTKDKNVMRGANSPSIWSPVRQAGRRRQDPGAIRADACRASSRRHPQTPVRRREDQFSWFLKHKQAWFLPMSANNSKTAADNIRAKTP